MIAPGKKGYSPKEIIDLFDDDIDEIIAGLAEVELTPQEAVDLSELVATLNGVREAVGHELVPLPPALHRQINKCAKRGMRKGGGRKGRPSDSLLIGWLKDDVVEQAELRKDELKIPDDVRNLTDAEGRAYEEAADTLRDYGIKRGLSIDALKKRRRPKIKQKRLSGV